MKTVIEMAREAGCALWEDGSVSPALERFAELVRAEAIAEEREAAYKRRGVLMFNPYTGTPRHPSDIAIDPHGILMLDPEQPIRARSNT